MPREKGRFSRISGVRDPSLIVIACEGDKTEVQYFQGVQSKLGNSRLKIETLKRADPSKSAPKHVLEELDNYRRQNGLGANDELCMVIDRDCRSWDDRTLATIAQICDQKQYLLALSNPAFEFWLLLHHASLNDYDAAEQTSLQANHNGHLKKELRRLLGSFNPSNPNIDDFWPQTAIAIERADELDTDKIARWPNGLGTRVYRILQKVLVAMDK